MKSLILKLTIVSFLSFFLISSLYAEDLYVDNTLSINITDGTYSIANRDSSGSDGNAYTTIQTAINEMNGGDDIFLRHGTYLEHDIYIPASKTGTQDNWSSLQSYPGEWAKIDGEYQCQSVARAVISNGGFAHQISPGDHAAYWKFSRLEITGGGIYDSRKPLNGLIVTTDSNSATITNIENFEDPHPSRDVWFTVEVNGSTSIPTFYIMNSSIASLTSYFETALEYAASDINASNGDNDLSVNGLTITSQSGYSIDIFNFEITLPRTAAGLWFNGGPVQVRYCYIHDNLADHAEENPAGFNGCEQHDTLIEYCYFKNNGTSGIDQNYNKNARNIMFTGSTWYPYEGRPHYNVESYVKNNEIRYNLIDTNGSVGMAIKAAQRLTSDREGNDNTAQEWGDKIHHNIILGSNTTGISWHQDYVQIYKNIIKMGDQAGEERYAINVHSTRYLNYDHLRTVIYNNTIIDSHAAAIFNDHHFRDGEDLPLDWWVYNNVIDNHSDDWDRSEISFSSTQANSNIPLEDIKISRNYSHAPATGYGSQNEDIVTIGSENLNKDEFEARSGRIFYYKADIDIQDPLFQGDTGASQYKTRADHVISDTTIRNGGVNENHPYLQNVQLPSYIGATNPDSNIWVEGVLSLAQIATLQSGQETDPSWIEESAGRSFTTAQSGDWSSASTWNEGGIPGADDTITITSGYSITISTSVTSGEITFDSGASDNQTELNISGSLQLNGNITLADYSNLNMTEGSSIDLNGNSITIGNNSNSQKLEFLGSLSNRITITSTTPGGSINGSSGRTSINWNYVDFSNMSESALNVSPPENEDWTIDSCTFTDCGQLQLGSFAYFRGSSKLNILKSDFKNQTNRSTQLYIYTSRDFKPQSASIDQCTFQGPDSDYSTLKTTCPGLVISNSIFKNMRWDAEGWQLSAVDQACNNSLWYATPHGDSTIILSAGGALDNNYFCLNQNNPHAFLFQSGANNSVTQFRNNIIEATYLEVRNDPGNFCYVYSNDLNVTGNIFIDDYNGALVSAWGGAAKSANINIYNNTCYTRYRTDFSAPLLQAEGAPVYYSGHITLKNNLVHNYGVTPSRGTQLNPGTPDQVDSAGYNAWSNVEAPYFPSGDEINYEGHDIYLGINEPLFSDATRTFAQYDLMNDTANGIDEFLKLNKNNYNPHYNLNSLMTYLRDGFKPQNIKLKGTGENGVDVGAVAFTDPVSISGILKILLLK